MNPSSFTGSQDGAVGDITFFLTIAPAGWGFWRRTPAGAFQTAIPELGASINLERGLGL